MRGVGVEAGQWRSPRYGLPGTPLATAAGGAPGVAARAAGASQPRGPARHARGESPGSAPARYHAPGSAPAGAAARGVSASAAHAGGAALQRPCRPVSSPRLCAAGGGTPQISGLGCGPGDCLPGVVLGPAASGRGDRVLPEAVDSADAVPPRTGRAPGLEPRGARPEEMHSAPQKLPIL